MTYLQDRQFVSWRKKRRIYFGLFAFAVIVLYYLFNGQINFFLTKNFYTLIRPLWLVKNSASNNFLSNGSTFKSKDFILTENDNLKMRVLELEAKIDDRNVLYDENLKLKDILGRKEENNLVLAVILSKPNKSIYDTLIIDVGENKDIKIGQKVYAYGNILIGEIAEVYGATAKVKLFSTYGEKLEVVLDGNDIYTDAVGRGGGTFEITLPRNVLAEKGQAILFPDINVYPLAYIESIISDERDPFQKILLRSPVNVQELKFVEIEQVQREQ
ncbi:MAG: hypothetical protein US50_C0025G0004 [Candidatus Nomurabacteria bacterium GW2011_GWB1_37_5]|uniref:Rod shape-determining protein MreC beta-barrel core domain-containing protein n=1 Tax=Candidatus Nomurabacteria bacterium GW2011_GWB1_37_5 TaxID=1618742 RepID=A0A0G0H9B8_9BACT|nr:MAG: hypothetical protein US50_C0025G0004 [Candidatus Nomurabacteria bacterium GW2011_GWB1_37_5]